MSYDIPDAIQYKEKIVFNLDVKQLMYAVGFSLLAFFSYGLPIEGELKLLFPAFFFLLGMFFIWFNLEEKVTDLYGFYTGIRKASSSDKKAQSFMEVNEIKKDAVFLNNGGLRAILQVEPINFSLLDKTQKQALILNYREFLNHLTAPIQILVITNKPDLGEYFTKAQERLSASTKELRGLFDDFLLFEQDFLEKNRVMDRKYFLVIPHLSSNRLVKKALSKENEELKKLEQKTKIIQEKLLACGLQSKRLETSELRGFFAQFSSQEQETSEEPATEVSKNEDTTSGETETKVSGKKG